MKFHFTATTQSGRMEHGTIDAPSVADVREYLQKKSLFPVTIQKQTERQTLVRRLGGGRGGRLTVSLLDRVIVARHLSIMLQAGMSLAEGLDVLREQAQSSRMKRIMEGVREHVVNGKTLGASFAQYPKVFSDFFIGMVKVGEASGTLERNLEYVASQLERDYDLRRKVRTAMIYPTIVLSATVVLGTVLSVFILPKLVRMFNTFRLELPPITRLFVNVASFLVEYGWYVLGGVVVIGAALAFVVRIPGIRSRFHSLLLRMPLIQRLVRGINLARLTQSLGILLKSGVPISESIHITARVVGNIHYKRLLERSFERLQQGKSLASSLDDTKCMPTMAHRMIDVGEKSGKLEECLAYLAKFYEGEVDGITKNLATVVEPFLLVVIGVILGFLAVAIISPIYQFTGSIGR